MTNKGNSKIKKNCPKVTNMNSDPIVFASPIYRIKGKLFERKIVFTNDEYLEEYTRIYE